MWDISGTCGALTACPLSDTRLPLVIFEIHNCTTPDGRKLAHREDEGTARSFMMVKGTLPQRAGASITHGSSHILA
jgi:hypothetical protein